MSTLPEYDVGNVPYNQLHRYVGSRGYALVLDDDSHGKLKKSVWGRIREYRGLFSIGERYLDYVLFPGDVVSVRPRKEKDRMEYSYFRMHLK